MISALIRFWPSKLFQLGLPQLQVLLVDFKRLLVGKLGFLGTVGKDLGIDLVFEIKILPNKCSFILIGKSWKASNLVTFFV